MHSLKGLSVRGSDMACYWVFENCLFPNSKKPNVVLLQEAYKTSIQSAAIKNPLQVLPKRKGYYIPNKNKRNITMCYKPT